MNTTNINFTTREVAELLAAPLPARLTSKIVHALRTTQAPAVKRKRRAKPVTHEALTQA